LSGIETMCTLDVKVNNAVDARLGDGQGYKQNIPPKCFVLFDRHRKDFLLNKKSSLRALNDGEC